MFVITQNVNVAKTYSGLAITTESTDETVEVKYTVLGIMELTSGSGTAEYQASIGDSLSPVKLLLFNYSGSGDPFKEAEETLEKYISTQGS